MHNDTAFKQLLDHQELLLRRLLGEAVVVKRSLPTELQGNAMHVDMLIELEDGRIVHIELQGYPDPHFAYRMLTYRIRIRNKYHRVPLQFALWLGQDAIAIPSGIDEPGHQYSYPVVDFKNEDTTSFLESPSLRENLFGLLGKLKDSRRELERILGKIARLPPNERQDALRKLLVVSKLKRLDTLLAGEMQQMPIVVDLRESLIVQKFIEEGREEGLEKGREEGLAELRRVLTLQLNERFGKVPAKFARKIGSADRAAIEQLSLRFVKAHRIEDVFGSSRS